MSVVLDTPVDRFLKGAVWALAIQGSSNFIPPARLEMIHSPNQFTGLFALACPSDHSSPPSGLKSSKAKQTKGSHQNKGENIVLNKWRAYGAGVFSALDCLRDWSSPTFRRQRGDDNAQKSA